MKNNPLVSVNIPTFNNEKTIRKTLESVKNQDYKNLEIIVIDSNSKDKTVEIAKELGTKIITYDGKLLGARDAGVQESKGKYILLLDSDQILEKTIISRCVKAFDKNDMLILEEFTYHPINWLQKLFEADRKLIHAQFDVHKDPLEGVLLARFYKKDLLKKAFKKIPKELLPIVVAHDHAFIYYEACKISQKVNMVKTGVWHIEPSNIFELWKKNYRYGKTTKDFIKSGYYRELLTKKVCFRKGAFSHGNIKNGMASYALLLLKGIPYQLGYWSE